MLGWTFLSHLRSRCAWHRQLGRNLTCTQVQFNWMVSFLPGSQAGSMQSLELKGLLRQVGLRGIFSPVVPGNQQPTLKYNASQQHQYISLPVNRHKLNLQAKWLACSSSCHVSTHSNVRWRSAHTPAVCGVDKASGVAMRTRGKIICAKAGRWASC